MMKLVFDRACLPCAMASLQGIASCPFAGVHGVRSMAIVQVGIFHGKDKD